MYKEPDTILRQNLNLLFRHVRKIESELRIQLDEQTDIEALTDIELTDYLLQHIDGLGDSINRFFLRLKRFEAKLGVTWNIESGDYDQCDIFTESERAHLNRLHKLHGIRLSWKRLYLYRWTLRLKRRSHEQGQPLTNSDIKSILSSLLGSGTQSQDAYSLTLLEISQTSIEKLERNLLVQWDGYHQMYEPAML